MSGTPSNNQVELINKNDLDLFKLFKCIWDEKQIPVITVIIFVVLAGLYAFSVTPVHQSRAFFTPVDQEFIHAVNKLDLVLNRNPSYNNERLIDLFKHNVLSRHLLDLFFEKHKLYYLYDSRLKGLGAEDSGYFEMKQSAFDEFMENFEVKIPSDTKKLAFSISLSLPLPKVEVQRLLNDYVQIVLKKTRSEVVDAIMTEKRTRIAQLKIQINSKRVVSRDMRSDRVAQLNEAVKIAKTLNIKEPWEVGAKATIKGVSNQGLPLYYLGYRLLEAEKEALLERESDDPFIDGLRDIQDTINLLKSVELTEQDFKAVNIDQSASIGEKIKPKKAVILVISSIVGFLMGVFIIMVKLTFNTRNAKVATESE